MPRLIRLSLPLLATLAACTAAPGDRRRAEMITLGAPRDSATGLEAPEVAIEIGDGIVVLPDPGLPGVLRLDLPSGLRDSVGRAGDGPGEFRSPFYVQSLNAGSILVLDGLARRVTVLDPSLAFREQRTDFAGLPPFALRFDTLGNSLSVGQASGRFVAGDSLPVLRKRPGNSAIDTVTFVQRMQLHPVSAPPPAIVQISPRLTDR